MFTGRLRQRGWFYFFEKNDEMLFVPLAALANCFSFADTFFSWTVANGDPDVGGDIVSMFADEKSSSDLTRFNVLFSNSMSDFRLPGAAAFSFSKPRCVDNFSLKSSGM